MWDHDAQTFLRQTLDGCPILGWVEGGRNLESETRSRTQTDQNKQQGSGAGI